jgi:hypothetical protein
MKNVLKILVLISFIFFNSCIEYGYDYPNGSLPSTPVNLSDFNTRYDDFNAASPYIRDIFPLCFSTNRNSNGNEFDIICQVMEMRYSKMDGILEIINQSLDSNFIMEDYDILEKGLNKIKTTGNEFGPYLITEKSNNYSENDKFTLLYSTNITGNAQINYISNKTTENFSTPKEVGFLNSKFEDLYPTFNTDKTKVYFCSNRNEKDFNFYFVNLNPTNDIEVLLSDTSSYEVLMDSTLSSSSDDKCPYILGDKMVFTSNRSGGFGGYDLYYSVFKNGKWSAPVNFGENINSKFDEFRPILLNQTVSENQTMMIFSSNRPGGLGGYDLYYTGIQNE